VDESTSEAFHFVVNIGISPELIVAITTIIFSLSCTEAWSVSEISKRSPEKESAVRNLQIKLMQD